MKYNEFLKDIKTNKLKNVYLLYGEENYLIDYCLRYLKKIYIDKKFESLNYIVFDEKNLSFESICNACETLPFMSNKKIVVVKNLGIFTRKNKSSKSISKDEEKKLAKYILSLENYLCLLFIEKEKKIDRVKSIVKNIKKIGDVVEFKKIRGKSLNDWIQKTFNKNKKKISYSSIEYFIQYCSYFQFENKTLYDLENEINKLCNYIGNRREITKEDIDKITAKSLDNNIFKLVDSISQKNVNDSLRIFNEMILSNKPIQLILYMIIRQLRLILVYGLLKQKGYDQYKIMSKLKIGKYEYQKIVKQNLNFSFIQVEKALNYCLETDEKIKKGLINNKIGIEMLIVKLCY